jgi:choline/glycine/proline betaine transport protein
MFIARISVGRTIREFVLGVLIVPTLLTFLWLTAFGGTAISLELREIGSVASAVQEDVSISLYALLDNFPISSITNLLAMILVISFFVTSSDSGSLVVDIFTSGGKLETPVYQRVFWAFSVGGVAAVLLFGGGLQALQTAAITTGLPFAVILVIMSRSLFKGIRKEYYQVIQLHKEEEKDSYRNIVEEVMKKNKPKK